MMAMRSVHDQIVLSIVATVIAFGVAVGLWFMRQSQEWKKAERHYRQACAKLESENKLISEKKLWDARFDEESAAIRTVDEGKQSDTIWLPIIDRLAAENYVFVSSSQVQKEVEAGDMKQIGIEVHWDAAFESLVKFLYALETTDEGKFDVESINFSTTRKQGYLKGSLVLTCVFYRK